jgi:hypothetical protein
MNANENHRNGETISEESASVAENYPMWCVALYDYQVKFEYELLLLVCDRKIQGALLFFSVLFLFFFRALFGRSVNLRCKTKSTRSVCYRARQRRAR